MKKSKFDWNLYLILLIAFILRIPGIIDGLPAVYNSTEHFLARTALSMGADKTIDPGVYIYPTFYTYLLLLLFGCLYFFGGLIGFYENQYDFAVQFLIDPSAMYMVSRSLNVILSLVTILIIYKFLRHRINSTAAKIASLLMAFSFYLIRFSGFATADTLLILFSTLSIVYFYKLIDSKLIKDYFFTGLFCGLAIASKYNAGFLVIGLIIIVIQNWRIEHKKFLLTLGLSLGGVAVGFLSTNPLWLIYPGKFYQGWQIISSQMYNAVSGERGIDYIWEISQLVQNELVLGILFIVATVYYIFRKEKKHYPALIVVLLTFLYVGTWTKKGIDYLFAIFPAWIIFSVSLIDQIQTKYIHKRLNKIVLIFLIILPSFASAVHHFIVSINPDTREKATDWMVTHISKNQKVCYDNYHNDLGVFDIERYISYGRSAGQLPEKIKQRLHKFSNDKRQIRFIPILVENLSKIPQTDNLYDEIAFKYRRRDLKELLELDTSIFISNSWYYSSYSSIDIEDYSPGVQLSIKEVQYFYQQLNQNYTPVKIFSPNFWTTGPELCIYNLKNMRPLNK